MKLKPYTRPFILALATLLIGCGLSAVFPVSPGAAESPKRIATTEDAIRFVPPDPDGAVRRRERSVEEGGSRGYARGLTRGYARGITRGYARGLTRGYARGLTRGYARGLTRGYARGLTRGYARGLTRGYARGLTRGYARGLTRGYARGLTRGYARGLTRGYSRGLTRGYARGLTRGFAIEEIAQLTLNLPEMSEMPDTAQEGEEALPIPDPPATIAPLAPKGVGLSASPRPVLYWYVSAPWPGKIEFTLNEEDRIDPLILTPLDPPEEEGIYAIDLGDYAIVLKPDVEYEWFVSIIPLPAERSFDFLAGAPIRYIPPAADREATADAYAAAGYWYDAMDLLCSAIDDDPEDPRPRALRAALMDQVELPPVAAYDRE